MQLSGRCHCGAITYEVSREQPMHHAICHCTDCRRTSGAPGVAWALFSRDAVSISGEPKVYASSEHARWYHCSNCGTGLYYTNEAIFPGMIDIQSATLDDPDAIPLRFHVQIAERIGWMENAHTLPQFERYPEPG